MQGQDIDHEDCVFTRLISALPVIKRGQGSVSLRQHQNEELSNQAFATDTLRLICTSRSTRLTPSKI